MTLQRRNPIRPSTIKRWESMGLKPTVLQPRSAKKIAADAAKAPIREAVFKRDGGCVLEDFGARSGHRGVPACFGRLTPHHLRKAKQGGPYHPGNLVTLCAFHNDWVEIEPLTAHSLGLVCRIGEHLDECWAKMREAGLVA